MLSPHLIEAILCGHNTWYEFVQTLSNYFLKPPAYVSHQPPSHTECNRLIKSRNTETAIVRTLMARLRRLFQTRFLVPRNIFHNCK